MAKYEEASPICRGKNLSWETVLLFYNNMPRTAMPKATFHASVELKINGWTQTHSQIARQLAFYYEQNGMCYPRFTEGTTYADLFLFMQNWASKYFVPNPYAPSLKEYEPVCLYLFLKNSIEQGNTDFDAALDSIFDVKLSSHDKVNVYLSNFTNIVIDGNHQMRINDRIEFPEVNSEILNDYVSDAKKYFDYFTTQNKTKKIQTKISSIQIIFYGAPGTGKSHEVKRITGECDDEGQKNVFRTTFHPDTDYATFVGCYKPTMKDVPEKYKAVAGKDSEISYEFVPQTFTDAYVYAYKHPDTTTYLVIEEINRGNCAQIFGDLFQLLDRKEDGTSEYRIKADKDLAKHLINEGVASGDPKDVKLCLPANLHILATMNTSDQSLFPMDSAFKRRWDWEYIPISYTEEKSSAFEIEIGEEKYSWVKFIEAVNKRILNLTDSEDKMMGNFFIKSSVNKQQFKSKVMFYLWNEVLRDEVGNQKYFFYWRDENNKDHSFKFNEIYEKDSDMILKGFMAYIFEKKFNQKSESSVDE